jgi:ABC-type amino acid transport substrate-binding protein
MANGSRHNALRARSLLPGLWLALATLLLALLLPALGCSGQGQAASVSTTGPGAVDVLTPAERQWLTQKQTLLVGAFSDYPPLGFVDENGLAVGITVDYWRLVAQRLGTSVAFMPGYFSDQMDGLKAGRLDSMAGVFALPARAQYLDFSDPYYAVQTCIYTDAQHAGCTTLASLRGLIVAVVDGDSSQTLADDTGLPTLVVKGYPQAVLAVASGKAQATILDRPVAEYYIPRYGLTGKVLEAGNALGTWQFTMPVAKGDTMLLSILKKGQALVSPAEVDAIVTKWSGE